jgi:RHS repeat-associated protein
VTDQNARVHEHVEYFPYGEVWRDPRSDVGASPVKGQRFLFTGKELDEETGLYYFGARYYDPIRVRWVSPDPILNAYLDGAPNGGVFSARNIALYSYGLWSPVRLTDPDGQAPRAASELADAWEVQRQAYRQWLLNEITPNLSLGKAFGLAVTTLAVEVGAGTVDMLRFGEGAGEGGVRGWFRDTLRGVGLATLAWGISRSAIPESPGESSSPSAGSIRSVNPGFPGPGRVNNCVNCSIATDATLAWRPASALPSARPQAISVLEKLFGGTFKPATAESIAAELEAAGPGARGIVFGARQGGQAGHVFNAVNQRGTIRFLDGQTGGVASFEGYSSLKFLRTDAASATEAICR